MANPARTTTIEHLRELLKYYPETGVLTWLPRPESMFRQPRFAKIFNKRFAGKQAGSVYQGRRTKYLLTSVFGKFLWAHRAAWAIYYGKWPDTDIDHIDGNGMNNRIENLREATPSINGKNARMKGTNTSGYNGVYKHVCGKWCAQITINRRCLHLGLFENIEDAAAARIEAQKDHGFTKRHGM